MLSERFEMIAESSIRTVVIVIGVRAAAFDLPVAYAVYGLIAGSTIVAAHRDNIRRVLRGTERRIGEPVA